MIHERLDFQVKPGYEENFIDADEQIYGPWLRLQKGYLGKQVIRYPSGRVTFILRWKDKTSLDKASSVATNKTLDLRLSSKVGSVYRLISSSVTGNSPE